jgi:hypothetical protein
VADLTDPLCLCGGQIFNEFNARELFNGLNVFAGLDKNPIFLGIIVFTGLMQVRRQARTTHTHTHTHTHNPRKGAATRLSPWWGGSSLTGWVFCGVRVRLRLVQALIIEVGGMFVRTNHMPAELWGYSILFGFISLPWALIVKLALPIKEYEGDFFGYGASSCCPNTHPRTHRHRPHRPRRLGLHVLDADNVYVCSRVWWWWLLCSAVIPREETPVKPELARFVSGYKSGATASVAGHDHM